MKKKLFMVMMAATMAAMAVTGCSFDSGANIDNNGTDEESDMDGDKDGAEDDGKDNVVDGDGMLDTKGETITVTVSASDTGLSDEELYADAFAAMSYAISNPEDVEWDYANGTMGVCEASVYSENPMAEIGYAFIDVDNDGVNELLIGNVNPSGYEDEYGNEIYAVFTIDNGTPKCVISGWSRNRHYLMNDNSFLYCASNSYNNYGFGIQTLTSYGVISSNAVYVDVAPNGEDDAVYSNPSGNWDADSAYLTDLTLDDWNNAYHEKLENTQYVYYTPFEFYGMSPEQAGSSAILPLYLDLGKADAAVAEIVLTELDYAVEASVFANCDIDNLSFYKISSYDIKDSGEVTYTADLVEKYGKLAYAEELNLVITIPEIMPEYIIGYVDADGAQRYFTVECSGYDGSLFLSEIK